MSIMSHAKREMKIAGLFDVDSDYGGMTGHAVMRAVEVWSKEGHSGYSHALALRVFSKVVNLERLSPLTSWPEEWIEVCDGELWQSARESEAFSFDGGKTYYLLSETQDIVGCRKCGTSFTTRHPRTGPLEPCHACGLPEEILTHGKTPEDAMHTSAPPHGGPGGQG